MKNPAAVTRRRSTHTRSPRASMPSLSPQDAPLDPVRCAMRHGGAMAMPRSRALPAASTRDRQSSLRRMLRTPAAHLDRAPHARLSWAVQFAGPAEHYDRFMGRYAPTLAVALADAAEIGP